MTDVPSPDTAAPVTEVATGPAADAATVQLGGDQIIGMSFDKVTRAEEVLLALVHLQQEGEIAMVDAVIAAKDDEGKVHIHQTVDPTPGMSALRGSFWGALLGAIVGGPVFLAGALVGAGSGALMAKLVDLGLDDGWVKEVAHWLDPGTSALLLLVGAEVRPAVIQELSRYEGSVLYCTFPDTVRAELADALGDDRS